MPQLIDAKTDEHLWAGSYDRTMGDVINVQDEIALAVAREVAEAARPDNPADARESAASSP